MSLYQTLFTAVTLHAIGLVCFGHFEERTPVWRRLLKIPLNIGLAALLYQLTGPAWAIGLVFGYFALATGGHIWWALSHGIHPLTAEPREKYYALRGWK